MASRSSFGLFKSIGPALLLSIVVIAFLLKNSGPTNSGTPTAGPGEYLFCFWNVENLFDDHDDQRNTVDEEYDNWMANRPEDLQLKLDHLSSALLSMNAGRGPDILAVCEVESIRAAELLRNALNKKLPHGAAPYGEVQMKEVAAGRHIAPAVITRLPVDTGSTRSLGKGLRILETVVTVNNHKLFIVTSHWTSQLSDKSGDRRDRYADVIFEAYRQHHRSDATIDFLVCGDFNTDPRNESVTKNLRALGSRDKVAASKEPVFFNLFADKDPTRYGTLTYNKNPLIYDHICVSPGLLDDQRWSCDADSVVTYTDGLMRRGATYRQPWRFGNQRDSGGRGYSDHFPVAVKLKAR